MDQKGSDGMRKWYCRTCRKKVEPKVYSRTETLCEFLCPSCDEPRVVKLHKNKEVELEVVQ